MSVRDYPSHEAVVLKRYDRRVVRLEDFSDEEMALIAQREAPAEDARRDAELTDWKP